MTAVACAGAALTAVLPMAAPSSAATTALPVPNPTLYTERFGDDFNSTTLDTGKWQYRINGSAYSCQQPGNVSVDGSSLVIALKKETVTCKSLSDGTNKTYNWTGGGVISKQKFGYGYYEARVKMPSAPGWHSAFWAMCGDTDAVGNKCRKTEIDGFENESAQPAQIRHNIFDWSVPSGASGNEVSSQMYGPSALDKTDFPDYSADQWHTYGFLYDETGVTFYIDGKKAPHSHDVDANGKIGYTGSLHPRDLMNLWLTGIAYNAPTAATAPGTLYFDDVSYWEKDRYIDEDEQPAGSAYTETGTGWAKSGLAGFGKSGSRYSCAAGASARWSAGDLPAGTYTAWLYTVSDPNSATAAQLTYTNGSTVQSQSTLNQKTTATGWHQVGGNVTVTGGNTAQTIELTNGGSGCVRADAVKFVRTG